jgi:hypothetical protein
MFRKRVAVFCSLMIVCLIGPAASGEVLWGYYPIHENDFKDYSGNNHHGTPVDGAATVQDPVQGWVASFTVEAEKPSRINLGTDDPSAGGQLTVAAWLLWRGTNGNWQGIAGKSFSFTDRRWILQLRDTDGMIQWGGADNASLHTWSSVAPAVDEWQHVVGTCDGTTSRIFIDGEKVGEGAGHFAPGAANANVTLGFGEDRSDYDESLNGALDEIYIFTRGLSQEQVQDLAGGVLPAFDKARDPNPADGTAGVVLAILQWTAGDGAMLHNVYVGTTPELGQAELVGPRTFPPVYFYAAPLPPGTTYYWRVDEIQRETGAIVPGDVWSFTAQDLTAYLPNPADGAVDAPLAPNLTWQPGLEAIQHHVYFGSGLDAVTQGTADTDKGTRAYADANFAPGILDPVTTYYWRVDEILSDTTVRTGPVWSFTTYLSVDDFESYTDEVGQRIFQTWIDGLGYTEPTLVLGNGTGATVGHADPPFAEQKIVHSGLQSMPLDYNNISLPHYSEAERTFAPAADWTTNGANTLVLHVRGKATNKPGQLYVTVRDAFNREVFTAHSDDMVVTKTAWVKWEIPLSVFSDLGVNPAKIKQLRIGVSNEGKPAAGGAGSLYIDDIRAIKVTPEQ